LINKVASKVQATQLLITEVHYKLYALAKLATTERIGTSKHML